MPADDIAILHERIDQLERRIADLESQNRGRVGWQEIKRKAREDQFAAVNPDFQVCDCGLVKIMRGSELKCVICDRESDG